MLLVPFLCFALSRAMDFQTYSELQLNMPFEAKPRTKFDSGMDNPNREPGNDNKARGWQAMWAVLEKLAYPLPPISQPRAGAPTGQLKTFFNWAKSSVYPGTKRTWWYYVPAQYDERTAANLIVFLDGSGFLDSGGNFRATVVLDNLIADGLLPPTIAVFVNPGIRPKHPDCAYSDQDSSVEVGDDPERSLEYDTVSDRQSQFLLEDVLPVVERAFNITQDPRSRAVVGISSSAVGAFCAAWFRPDKFGLVSTYVGSFVNIRESHHLPWLIRNTPRKPIRVSLQSGERDMDNNHGSWALGNRRMAAALQYAGYEHKLDLGPGSHYGSSQGGSLFAGTLLWLFGVDLRRCPQCRAEGAGVLWTVAKSIFWLCSPAGTVAEW
mmetsp:Transcript_20801/g.58600  ORF Transcript_20801/g.58600 Transcript_20801/m.58600 type:complete len:380 (-) Transcript_20801:93-1232(-)